MSEQRSAYASAFSGTFGVLTAIGCAAMLGLLVVFMLFCGGCAALGLGGLAVVGEAERQAREREAAEQVETEPAEPPAIDAPAELPRVLRPDPGQPPRPPVEETPSASDRARSGLFGPGG